MIRIGTRNSELALWQARLVESKLKELEIESIIVPITSDGDLNLEQPLYEMGITGIFTKTLDVALLNNKIDIAVHSLKDVPTLYPKGITPIAYLERGNPHDILVVKNSFYKNEIRTIATGSLRRKAFWLFNNPKDKFVDLRGNLQTRLKKIINDNQIDGAFFAAAGLERCNMLEEIKSLGLEILPLTNCLPAPAQGAIMVCALQERKDLLEKILPLNNKSTEMEVVVERDFLNTIEGGCSSPIGAFAKINNKNIELTVSIFNLNGTKKIEQKFKDKIESYLSFGKNSAYTCLKEGAEEILKEIKGKF